MQATQNSSTTIMVQWNAEKDQVILKGIFKFHEIKNSAPLLEYLAKEIGDGCTPKAVSHRLNNIRNSGNNNGTRSSGGTRPNGSVTHTPTRATSTPRTPRSRAKATPNKKKVSSNESDGGPEGLLDEDDEVMSPLAARGKRGARQSYAEPESEEEHSDYQMSKRVKTEPIDDDNESTLGGVANEDVEEEEEV
ncbi:uncharacterized protein K460DRAFT_400929 [Cucurbitaria berberidis CBS 394.84]|uniref:Uncharacterized protein n=1 Tax=Cucurbitaria berberidis CBS 394.84 TaxID=1168544 RepID=A0A9P4LDC5_9PLEO|nr:uncharacterized protein K460DRAFT_400929 [Cucurbitaria berberidis CBS 394.84]KAF1850895.1 hypothetical protein K460DRAFT_400929 [Cucurbitaria berberidis CBS 394.84]